MAFSIAFGLHLMAVFLFNIRPFFWDQVKFFSPIEVQTDLRFALNDAGSLAYAKNEEKNQKNPYRPPTSILNMPSFPFSNNEMKMEFLQQQEPEVHAFLKIEEKWDFLLPQKSIQTAPVAINVSGNLSQFTLIEKNLANFPHRHLDEFRIVYDVQVELKSGKVFWHHIKLLEGNEKMKKMADEMLKALAFEAHSKGFVETGEIEFVFRKS